MNITVGGLPGTGTSTLCSRLAEATGLPYTYAGALFRAEAQARGMDLADFGRLCEADASVDKALDAKQLDLLRDGPVLLEGRLAGWLAHQEAIPALKVWVVCDAPERIRRLVERDGGTPQEQAARAQRREASEQARYKTYYGIDVSDLRPYDLVLDSTRQDPARLAALVLAAYKQG